LLSGLSEFCDREVNENRKYLSGLFLKPERISLHFFRSEVTFAEMIFKNHNKCPMSSCLGSEEIHLRFLKDKKPREPLYAFLVYFPRIQM